MVSPLVVDVEDNFYDILYTFMKIVSDLFFQVSIVQRARQSVALTKPLTFLPVPRIEYLHLHHDLRVHRISETCSRGRLLFRLT